MKTLELRDGEETKKVGYVKVTNPSNPNEFVYVEQNLYTAIVKELGNQGLSGFFDNLWGAVKGAVGGLVTGGPIAAIGGAIVGFSSGSNKKPTVAISPQANGQQQLTVTAPSQALVPATMYPQPQDNTLMYVSIAALAAIFLMKK